MVPIVSYFIKNLTVRQPKSVTNADVVVYAGISGGEVVVTPSSRNG